MQALVNEKYTPPNQAEGKEKSYEIKALTSLEFTRLMVDGSDKIKAYKGMEFKDVHLLLTLGLVDPDVIPNMQSDHHIHTAGAIFKKANLAEDERKNS